MTDEEPVVCVHGLGYVGLPTAAMLANNGMAVEGFDTDPDHRARLLEGTLRLDEPDLQRFVERAIDDGLDVVDEVSPAAFHLICVPTPYEQDVEGTDLSAVEAAGEAIAGVLRPGDTVVLASTVPPGTTAVRLRTILERSGLSAAEDFVLACSPETVLPGNTLTELRENDRIVGMVADRAPDRVLALYDAFVSGELRTADATTAEFVKLVQNAFRDVNVAFANEVAKLAHDFDVDSRRAIRLANEHPRVDVLRPGPGVGGHCLPIDPLFLGQDSDVPMLIETARTVNDGMVEFVTDLLTAALGDLDGTAIALLGAAYKGGVADTRQSPALRLADRLETMGVGSVRLTDPYVDASDLDWPLHALEDALSDADAAVLVTDHPEYGGLSPNEFTARMADLVVVDTRAMLDRERWAAAGFDVYQV